jgi:hypothetical protein
VVEGLPNGGGFYASRIDATKHRLIPGDSYSTMAVYALGADGSVRHVLDTRGWATRLFALR